MRVLVVLYAIAVALVAAPLGSGGGWATVGFEPLPDGMSAGGTWNPTIFVKQHGVTPLPGLQPVVDIVDGTGTSTKFVATETSEAGVYEAAVVFPTQGDWHVTIHSGFGDSQVSYGPVAIGPAGTDGGGSRELPVVGLGVLVLALLGGAVLLGARRLRRLTPASG
jgi:YtkA-like protein